MIWNKLNNNPLPTSVSFFDSPDPFSSFEFISPEPIHQRALSQPPKAEAQITCQSPEEGVALMGTFKLHENLLVYYKNEQPVVVLDILYASLSFVDTDVKNTQYKVELVKNQATLVLLFDQVSKAKVWKDCLRSVCILTNFYFQYKTVRLSAKGTLTSTHLMRSNTSSELFAVKRFTKNGSSLEKIKAQILDEISTINTTNHTNLIKVHEVYETDGSIYLVKEYIAGQTLKSLLQNPNFSTCLSDTKAAQIIKPVLSALTYLSSKDAVHGSLCPDNILIDQNGRIKISNLGQVNSSENLESVSDRIWGFTAPEAFKGLSSTKTDVFSIGCILFEILFGTPLFKGQTPSQTLQLNKAYSYDSIFNKINKELEDLHSHINKQGLELLLKLLHPDPETRISAEDALNDAYFRSPAINRASLNPSFLLICMDSISEQTPTFLKTSEEKWSQEKCSLLSPGFGSALQKFKSSESSTSRTADLSYYDVVNFQRQSYLKKETYSDDEDEGSDIKDIDDEKSTKIGNFLDTHKIQVVLKNPGRF